MIYEFENCTLDTSLQELRRDGDLVPIEPQVFAVLEYLLTHRDRVVSKIELLDEVWGDRFVSESALTSRIKLARRACGDSGQAQRVIKTVHGRGYRVVAIITERGTRRTARAADRSPQPAGAVGREREISTLIDSATAVAEGSQTTVFISGPAGAGKSTVVAEFLERFEEIDQWLVMRGRCHRPRSGPEPYFALLDALGSLGAAEPDLVRATLDRVAPSWLLQLPALVDDDTASRLERRLLGGARQRMLREGADAFAALAGQSPTLLVVEDLHQADDYTLDVLELISSRRDPAALLIVTTGRSGPEQVDALIAEAKVAGSGSEIPLAPLDKEDIARLITDRYPDATIAPELIELANDRSEGNPLFAQEVVTAWEAAGLLVVRDEVLTTNADLEALAAVIPPGLAALIERTLAGLGPDELTVLEAASVAGVSFDAAAVAAALDRSVNETEAMLAHMARSPDHIDALGYTTWPDGTASTAYTFVHQLHREIVHDRIAPAQLVGLHRRVGLALEAGYQTSLDQVAAPLADHFVAAGDAARAARYLRRVGTQAMARQAYGPALDVLRQALQECARLEPGSERDSIELKVTLSLGQARVGVAGWFDEQVTEHYERALKLAEDLRAPDDEAHARYALATISEMDGDFERTERLLTPVLTSDSELEMEAHELVACSTFHQGAFERSEQNSEAVLSQWSEDASSEVMAQVAEHPATSCNSWMSLTNWFLGRSDDSLRRAENAVRLGERHRYALAVATQQRAMLHQLRNEPDECCEWAEHTLALERPFLSKFRRLQAEVLRGWALAKADRNGRASGPDAAGASMEAAIGGFREAGVRLDAPYYLALYGDVLIESGRPAEALGVLEEAQDLIDARTRAYFHRSEILRLRGQAIRLLGQPDSGDRARAELDDSLTLAQAMGSPALALRTLCDRFELETEAGDPERWREPLSRLVDRYDGQAPTPDVLRAQALLGS